MDSLEGIFNDLGIAQYLDAFVDQGFDSWETILDITESDLDALGVKLGHRRKLQRRIANHRGHAPAASIVSPTRTSIEEPTTTKTIQPEVKDATVSTKRKYRRHPKPDENAPERPPSAYVLFSNKMREDLKGQNLTFTEIAKLVGENWQSLDRLEKEPFEIQAQALKERYTRDMTEYKKTADYRRYCEYLQEFRKRQALHDKDVSKRARMGGDSNSRGSNSRMYIGSSATTSRAGSGSDSQPGSEPPPTRPQRRSSLTLQSDSNASPPTHVFAHKSDDMSRSPRSTSKEDGSDSRPRGFSNSSNKDTTDYSSHRHHIMRDGHRSEGSTGFLPAFSNSGESRVTMAPISHSPENGMPSVVPPGLGEAGSNSTRSSASSKFWSRTPSLRTEPSSSGSVSTLSSFAPPRTPSESSLPIHALLSSKPPTPTPQTTPTADGPIPAQTARVGLHQYPDRPPDGLIDSRLPYTNGNYPPITATQLPPLTHSLGFSQDQVAHPLNKAGGAADPGLDGMSALLRASDIVGRQN